MQLRYCFYWLLVVDDDNGVITPGLFNTLPLLLLSAVTPGSHFSGESLVWQNSENNFGFGLGNPWDKMEQDYGSNEWQMQLRYCFYWSLVVDNDNGVTRNAFYREAKEEAIDNKIMDQISGGRLSSQVLNGCGGPRCYCRYKDGIQETTNYSSI